MLKFEDILSKEDRRVLYDLKKLLQNKVESSKPKTNRENNLKNDNKKNR